MFEPYSSFSINNSKESKIEKEEGKESPKGLLIEFC
jgi:hypothetical protein